MYPCSTKTREVLGNPSGRPRDFPRTKPKGNLEGRGKSQERRGWISQYLPSFGGVRTLSHHQFSTGSVSENPSLGTGKDWHLTVLKSIIPCWWWENGCSLFLSLLSLVKRVRAEVRRYIQIKAEWIIFLNGLCEFLFPWLCRDNGCRFVVTASASAGGRPRVITSLLFVLIIAQRPIPSHPMNMYIWKFGLDRIFIKLLASEMHVALPTFSMAVVVVY